MRLGSEIDQVGEKSHSYPDGYDTYNASRESRTIIDSILDNLLAMWVAKIKSQTANSTQRWMRNVNQRDWITVHLDILKLRKVYTTAAI